MMISADSYSWITHTTDITWYLYNCSIYLTFLEELYMHKYTYTHSDVLHLQAILKHDGRFNVPLFCDDCTMRYDLKYELFFKSAKELKVEVEWNIKILFVRKLGVNLLKLPEHFVN